MVIKGTTSTRDLNGKHGLGKTTNLRYTTILGVTLHKGYRKMEISTRNTEKNIRREAKVIKQKKDAGMIRNRKEKTRQGKLTI